MSKASDIFEGFKNLVTGKEIPQEKKRMAICKRCPNFSNMKRCNICGCYMPAKVKVEGAKCPKNKW